MKPGQTILDSRDADGAGIVMTTTKHGTVMLKLNDGKNSVAWDCDRDMLAPGKLHHIAAKTSCLCLLAEQSN